MRSAKEGSGTRTTKKNAGIRFMVISTLDIYGGMGIVCSLTHINGY